MNKIPPPGKVTLILEAMCRGEPTAAAELLPLVYAELRRLAAKKMAHERPGQTLQATALVHEAYLRLVAPDGDKKWEGRRHFMGAAAEAMRRILVENARARDRQKRGAAMRRSEIEPDQLVGRDDGEQLLVIDDLLTRLEELRAQEAQVVKLRVFCGMTIEEIAGEIGVSRRQVDRLWARGRAWILAQCHSEHAFGH
jgi:RNA polymerase sigma factor (TIGR02999 family)